MSFEQSFIPRLVIPVNILIAWPYGIYRDLFSARYAKFPIGLDKKSGGYPRQDVQSPVYVDLVSGGRRLASDYGGSRFKHRCFDVDGGQLWLPRLLGRRLFKVSRYQQVKKPDLLSRLASPVASLIASPTNHPNNVQRNTRTKAMRDTVMIDVTPAK